MPVGLGEPSKGSSMRSDILAAAAGLIAEKGYPACTMRAVADKVKIKAGSLYYHFTSKDQIVEEILNSGIQLLMAEVQARLEGLPPAAGFRQKLETLVETHVTCMTGEHMKQLQVYEHLPPVLKRRSRAMREQYAGLWMRLFETGVEEGEVDADLDLRIVVPYVLGSLNRVPEWSRHGKFRRSEIFGVVLPMILKGIGRRPPAKAAGRKAGTLERGAA